MASGSVSQTLGPGDVVNNLTSTATDKPLSANMGKMLNDKLKINGDVIDLVSTIRSTFSGIDANDSRIVFTKQGNFNSIQFHFKASALSSGSVNISSKITVPKTEIYCSLISMDAKTGWAQLDGGGILYLRTQTSTSQYLCGQMTWWA